MNMINIILFLRKHHQMLHFKKEIKFVLYKEWKKKSETITEFE